jgi:SAM-dependent methyltransferase
VSVPAPPTPSCGLCGQPDPQFFLRLSSLDVHRCHCCRSTRVVFPPEASIASPEIAEVNGERYRHSLLDGKANACRALLPRAFSGRSLSSLRVLDVGCGDGAFLNLMRAEGAQTFGVEIDPRAALHAASRGHAVWLGDLGDALDAFGGSFDLVTMWDVLEHLTDPGSVLATASQGLAERGRLVLLTPAMGTVYDRVGAALNRMSRGKLNQLADMCWTHDHLYRFDAEGLVRVLRSFGLSDVRVRKELLLSLQPDGYAGGEILRSWTPNASVNRLISRAGVAAATMIRLRNKVFVEGTRAP